MAPPSEGGTGSAGVSKAEGDGVEGTLLHEHFRAQVSPPQLASCPAAQPAYRDPFPGCRATACVHPGTIAGHGGQLCAPCRGMSAALGSAFVALPAFVA